MVTNGQETDMTTTSVIEGR